MAKFYGAIGYASQTQISSGVWDDIVIERFYSGEVIQKVRRWTETESVNDNLEIENRISIVADLYAYANFPNIRYITYMGTKWTVTRVEINRPRLLLSIGSVYNGPAI